MAKFICNSEKSIQSRRLQRPEHRAQKILTEIRSIFSLSERLEAFRCSLQITKETANTFFKELCSEQKKTNLLIVSVNYSLKK